MFRIFGPPGTGKTTTLLNMVDKALESGVLPQEIAFLAFTKKAATEAKERAAERFSLDAKNDLIFFRTLHSLALSMTDISSEQIMQPEHYKELSHAIGVELFGSKQGSDDFMDLAKTNDPLLGLINLARLRKVPLREQYNESELDVDWNTVNYVDKSLRKYKLMYNLCDFTDMLELFVEQAPTFKHRFKLTFLDEAQDLSPLQWDIAHILDDMSDKMYCAGDDDQAIYRWAGADVDHFINLDGGSEILAQSYRVPSSVHAVAENISNRISRRFPKRYEPKTDRGQVTRYLDHRWNRHG
jgi:DNA helicase-2/ATP-dependent DNA helicase PcrA